jgi:hydroxypyruvate isomerase
VDKPGRTPNTLFAVNLEMWFKGPFEHRIQKAADLGFPSVEFWPYQGKNIDALAKLLRENKMTATQFTAWGFGTELNNPRSAPDKFLQAIEDSCRVAATLPGCDLFTVVVGNNIKGLSKDAMHAAAVEKIKKAVPLLEKHQKTIILEPMNPYNHPGHCLYGSQDGIAICKAVDAPWVKLNWDLFHMQRFEGNLIDNMRRGKDYIGYLQLADSPDRNEPGTGEINYTNVFKAARKIGYKRPIGLECSPQGGDVVRAARRVYAADSWQAD